MREYGRVHGSFWTSPTIRSLSEDGQKLAFYLLTSPHTTMLGCFRLPMGYALDDLRWGMERFSGAMSELVSVGFAMWDEPAGWVFICKFLKWNPAKGPKQGAGAAKCLKQVPEASPLRTPVEEAIRWFSPDVHIPKPKPIDTVSKAYRLQEQEQDSSEPNGSGTAAPSTSPSADMPAAPDWPTRLFREGVKIVHDLTGNPDSSARQLIGKWRKAAKDDCRMVLRVLEDARDHNPADPVSWIEGALKNRGKPPSGDIMSMVMARH